MYKWAFLLANAGPDLMIRYNNILNWLKRCQGRAAYKAAVEKGVSLSSSPLAQEM